MSEIRESYVGKVVQPRDGKLLPERLHYTWRGLVLRDERSFQGEDWTHLEILWPGLSKARSSTPIIHDWVFDIDSMVTEYLFIVGMARGYDSRTRAHPTVKQMNEFLESARAHVPV